MCLPLPDQFVKTPGYTNSWRCSTLRNWSVPAAAPLLQDVEKSFPTAPAADSSKPQHSSRSRTPAFTQLSGTAGSCASLPIPPPAAHSPSDSPCSSDRCMHPCGPAFPCLYEGACRHSGSIQLPIFLFGPAGFRPAGQQKSPATGPTPPGPHTGGPPFSPLYRFRVTHCWQQQQENAAH